MEGESVKKVLAAVLALAVLGVGLTAPAHASNRSKAVVATKKAVFDKYPILYGKVRNVSCVSLNRVRFKCSWKAKFISETMYGKSRVRVYARGGDARLYGIHCYRKDGQECYLIPG